MDVINVLHRFTPLCPKCSKYQIHKTLNMYKIPIPCRYFKQPENSGCLNQNIWIVTLLAHLNNFNHVVILLLHGCFVMLLGGINHISRIGACGSPEAGNDILLGE